jgi:hypothetical protein
MKWIHNLLTAGALTLPSLHVSAQSEEDTLKLVQNMTATTTQE